MSPSPNKGLSSHGKQGCYRRSAGASFLRQQQQQRQQQHLFRHSPPFQRAAEQDPAAVDDSEAAAARQQQHYYQQQWRSVGRERARILFQHLPALRNDSSSSPEDSIVTTPYSYQYHSSYLAGSTGLPILLDYEEEETGMTDFSISDADRGLAARQRNISLVQIIDAALRVVHQGEELLADEESSDTSISEPAAGEEREDVCPSPTTTPEDLAAVRMPIPAPREEECYIDHDHQEEKDVEQNSNARSIATANPNDGMSAGSLTDEEDNQTEAFVTTTEQRSTQEGGGNEGTSS